MNIVVGHEGLYLLWF